MSSLRVILASLDNGMALIRCDPRLKTILFMPLQPKVGGIVVAKKWNIQPITDPNGDETITAAKIVFDTIFNPVFASLGSLAEDLFNFRAGTS